MAPAAFASLRGPFFLVQEHFVLEISTARSSPEAPVELRSSGMFVFDDVRLKSFFDDSPPFERFPVLDELEAGDNE